MVRLSLIVSDPSGHSIDTVRKEEIRLLENGVPQSISVLSRDERPIHYGIAIDRSGSVRRVLQSEIDAAKAIIKNNRPGDQTFLESFVTSEKIETHQDFTANEASLIDGLDELFAEMGQSAVTDAVYLAVEHIAKHQQGNDERREALVLITDGDDRDNFYKHAALEKLLSEKRVQIFIVGFVSEINEKITNEEKLKGHRTRDEARALLERMAEVTGGRAFFPVNETELCQAVTEIDHDLRGQFSIAYQPADYKPGFHNVAVEIAAAPGREKLKATTRPGYFLTLAKKTKESKSQ